MLRLRLRSFSCIILGLAICHCVSGEEASSVTTEAHAEQIQAHLQKLDAADLEQVWSIAEKLTALGPASKPSLEERIKEASPLETIALGYALLRHGAQRAGTQALTRMMQDKKTLPARQIQAAALLGTHGGPYADWHIRKLLKDKALPERLRVELAKSLWKLTNGRSALDHLQLFAQESENESCRAEATLALGRFGRLELVTKELQALSNTPGRLGEEAQSLLALGNAIEKDQEQDEFPARLISEIISKVRTYSAPDEGIRIVNEELRKLARDPGPIGEEARALLALSKNARTRLRRRDFPADLITEIMEKVRSRYAPDETDQEEQEQLQTKTLAEQAARALLGSIDQFNDYLDEESLRSMEEQLRSSYGGIGAWVGMRNGRFTILTPMFGKPAYKAGLRSMDTVEKIDDTDITKMRLNKIISMLKGPPNTQVKVTVIRQGWKKARDFEIQRDTISLPSVLSQKLPGNIGYVRLNAFNEGDPRQKILGTHTLLKKALEEFKRDKVKGVVLDLTNNPGGLLQTSVDVCRLFLQPGQLIVYSKGKPEVHPRQNYHSLDRPPLYDGPLVVMVNRGSASASEIVAGALKDWGRAPLVGEKTFGKGSVQKLIRLATTRGLTRLKLTIAKYYLPKGKCIHGPNKPDGGIKPDIEVKQADLSPLEIEAHWQIDENRDIENWLKEKFSKHEKVFRELLAFDNYSPEGYPGFEELHKQLNARYPKLHIEPDTLRKEIRFHLRRFLKNNRGEDVPVDIEENAILQHALMRLGEMIPGGLPEVPVYQALRRRLEEEAEEVAAADDTEQRAAAPVDKPTAPDQKKITPDRAAPVEPNGEEAAD